MAQRKLAAIMFSDIVGYNSLLKKDEKKAFDARKKNQRIHKRLIKKFNGRWLKEMESGMLASFSSNIDAIMCAVTIQKATEELKIPLRIGIHLGDVIFEKKDVLGDGVNIASRIQSLVDTHGIVISEKVYSDIANKEGLDIEFLGEQELKGVSKPVGIYKVTCEDESLLDFTIDTGELVRPLSFGRTTLVAGIIVIALLSFAIYYFIPKTTSSSESKKNVLILPPENYLGIDTLDYLFASMHDALIADVGKIGALNVISRTSSVAFMKEGKSMSEIASEYNIDYIIESSVLCYSGSVCTQFKVYDDQENELSVQDISIEKSQILNLFRGITKNISEKINVVLTPNEEKLLAETRSVDDEAYDLYMKGRFYIEQFTDKDAFKKAVQYFKGAIEKDPTWAAPYAGIAEVAVYQNQFYFIPQSIVNPIIKENAKKALELDPVSEKAHFANAFVGGWGEYEESEREYKKALELNPNDAMSHVFYAHMLSRLRRTEEALQHAKRAAELDPLNPFLLGLSAMVLVWGEESQEALAQCEKALSVEPNQWFVVAGPLQACYLAVGDTLKWYEISRKAFWWTNEKVLASLDSIFHANGYIGVIKERIKTNEEVYSQGGQISFSGQANRYLVIKDYDKAMDYLEKGYEVHDPGMAYIGIKQLYDKLKDNPRYIALLKKMNLPVD